MGFYDIFNGDADGLCALQQLRLAAPLTATPVTGPKRDIALLDRVAAAPDVHMTVLDVSFEVNAGAVRRALEAGATIEWFDHHRPGDVAAHPRLTTHIDTAAELCTSAIVDRYLGGAHRAWAVAGAYGDNLDATAAALGARLRLGERDLAALRQLGRALNYNAYGDRVEELLFHPAELHARMRGCADPWVFLARDPAPTRLAEAMRTDLEQALRVSPRLDTPAALAVALPDAAWSRRVAGTLANHLARATPTRAHAVLVPSAGRYTVSLRSPLAAPSGADALAARFRGGGGRAAAAGINGLPEAEVEEFLHVFAGAWNCSRTTARG